MKFFTAKLKVLISVFAVVFLGLLASANIAAAQGPDVVFNNGSGVAGVGEEKDFLRISNANGGNTANACSEGQVVDLWLYIHNTNPTELNGANNDGVGVAKNTKVDVNFVTSGFAKSQEVSATVKADNSALAQDNAFINCDGQEISLEYVGQSLVTNAPQWTVPYTLTGNIMDNATVGYNGTFPGCFDFRAFITVKVKVHIKPEVKKLPATCDLIDVTTSSKTVTINKVNYTSNDATVSNLVIDFGNGVTKTVKPSELPTSYTYADATNRTVKVTLQTSMGNVVSDKCAAPITTTITPAVCDAISITTSGRTVTVTKVNYTSNSATVNEIVINFGNGVTKTVKPSELPVSYTYPKDGSYTINATLKTSEGEAAVNGCHATVKFGPSTITKLPDTGAAGTIAAFVGASFIGAFLYRMRALRSLN